MKKILYSIFFIVFTTTYSQSTYVNEDVFDYMSSGKIHVSDYDIKGERNVKLIKRLFPLYDVASAQKADYTEQIVHFDRKGRLTKKWDFFRNGDTATVTDVKYEDNTVILRTYNHKKDLIWKIISVYDTDFNAIKTEKVELRD